MDEYRSIFLQPIAILFLLICSQIAYLFKKKRKVEAKLELLLYLPLLLGTIQSGRVFVYFIFSLPFLLKEFSLLEFSEVRTNQRLEKAFCVILATAILALFHPIKKVLFPEMRLWSEGGIPKIVKYLEKSSENCHIFNEWKYGSHLSVLDRKITIDGRNVIYSQNAFLEYVRATETQDGLKNFIKKHNICYLVIDKSSIAKFNNQFHGKVVESDYEALLLKLERTK
jgi:hypothetical protein